jgi:hypothetical protein
MRNSRQGQAVLLLLLALGIFVIGAIGLAVESSLYYTHRQMAQAAADAAAQAAMSSIYTRTNTGANLMDGTPFDCTNGTDEHTPCYYARQHGFGTSGSADVVSVDFPTSIPGVGDLSDDDPAMVAVTVSRPVTTGLLQLVGATGATIQARAVAAIHIVSSPVPILVMHPDAPESMSINGNPVITICGGPPRSIQVNSIAPFDYDSGGAPLTAAQQNGNGNGNGNGGGNAFVVSGGGNSNLIDLSKAGPNPGGSWRDCNGTGGQFGITGGPFDRSQTSNGYPGAQILPPDGYLKTHPIDDPLAPPNMYEPLDPLSPAIIPTDVVATGAGAADPGGCPLLAGQICKLYTPGTYSSGILIKNEMALFAPGLYYITDNGFSIEANGIAHMAPCASDCGVIIYNKPNDASDVINFSANSGQLQGVAYSQTLIIDGESFECTGNCFQGPDVNGPYKNVVFMSARTTTFYQEHTFQGGGGLTLAGSLYFTNSTQPHKAELAFANGRTDYQLVHLNGNSGNTTQVVGQILVDSLDLGGTSGIQMTLNPNNVQPIRKLALVR